VRPDRSTSSIVRRRGVRRRLVGAVGVVVAAVAFAGCFGQGSYTVGDPLTHTQMPPGLWRSLGGAECTWARIDNASRGVVGRNIRTSGPQYMQLEGSDFGAAVGNCFAFWQQPGPFAKPAVQPGNPFGDGDFLVGFEVAPGNYRASSSGQQCTWAVVRGFHGKDRAGNNPDFVRGDTTSAASPVVQINSGDFGFTSQGCGEWSPTTAAPTSPTTTTTRPPTTTTTRPQPADPVFHVDSEDFPDPFVLRVDDASLCGGAAHCYYAYSTEAGFLGFINVPVIWSTDLVNWKWAGPPASGSTDARRDAMPNLASWVTFGKNWAPSVMYNTTLDTYVMYYTAHSKSTSVGGGRQCIGVATSSRPDGPFVDNNAQPLTCAGSGDNIDPSPFVDSSDNLWLQYADQNGLQSRALDDDGLGFANNSVTQILTPEAGWEASRIEGPSMIQTDETGILLLDSGNVFTSPSYGVGAARCTTPSSCARIAGNPVLSNAHGPGGQTPFQLANGSWQVAYHEWDPVVGYSSGGLRTLHIAPMTFSGSAPNQNPSIG
jgi:hypothetical protein